jgi:hypothetical protein
MLFFLSVVSHSSSFPPEPFTPSSGILPSSFPRGERRFENVWEDVICKPHGSLYLESIYPEIKKMRTKVFNPIILAKARE